MAQIGEKERQQRALMASRSKPARIAVARTGTTATPTGDGDPPHILLTGQPVPTQQAVTVSDEDHAAAFGSTPDEVRRALAYLRHHRVKARSAMASARARKKEVAT